MNKGNRQRHQKSPQQTSELFLKGQQLLGAGQTHQAGAVLRKVLKIAPRHADAAHLLGIMACQNDNPTAGIKYIRQAISAVPGEPVYHNNIGQAYKSTGQTQKAMESFRQAVNLNPDYAEAHYNLAAAYHGLERLEDAVRHYHQALTHRPDDAEAHYDLGIALKSLGRQNEAIESFEQALTCQPTYLNAMIAKGNALKDLGNLEMAVECFKTALSIQPNSAEVYLNLGNSYEELGRKPETISNLNKAIEINPGYAEAYRMRALAKRHTSEDDTDITAMEGLILSSNISADDRMHLSFGLGKAFEDLGQYEKAFEYFRDGNVRKRKTLSYSVEEDQEKFQDLKNIFGPELFKHFNNTGINDPTPLFVVGMPRSGTTLIEQILSSHPDVHGAGELNHLHNIMPDFPFQKLASLLADGIDEHLLSDFKQLGERYIREIRTHSTDARFITDKMPDNFLHIGLIRLALPKAKIIHCRRDPMDTCLSIFKTYFVNWRPYSFDQTEIGQNYNLYRDLMTHWHTVLPGVIFDIQYEDVVSDQLNQTKRLLKFCDLDWNDACLDFHKSDRPVSTASSSQVRQPLYNDSVQAWRRYETQLEPLRRILES